MKGERVAPAGRFLRVQHVLIPVYRSSHLVSVSALLLAMLLWGSSFVAMKYAFSELHPMIVTCGRMVIASFCFLPFIRSFVQLPLKKAYVLPLIGMAACEPCLYFLLEAKALELTTASQASMITTMLPLLVALAAGLFLGELVTGKVIIGLVVAAVGAIWLSLGGAASAYAPNPVLGNFLEFLAMVSAAGYIILLKKLSSSLPPLFLTAMQSFIGAIFFPVVLMFSGVQLPKTLPLAGLLAVLYLGTFVSVGAYGLYNFGVSRVPANQAAAFVNLIPVCTIVMGFVFLGERLTGWQIVACLLVFIGVIISQDKSSANKKERR